jgi:quercetin dioxygenase-like cupin family protein
MYTRHSTDGYREVAPGIELRTLSHGAVTLMAEFRLAAGHELPAHRHPHEQTGYLVRGRIRLRIGADEQELVPGDSWSVPGGTEHGATILEDSVAVEVFSPVRQDLLPIENRS